MEAYAARLPVVSFLPIAGHGRENAERMAEFGSSRYARTRAELFAALEELTAPGGARDRQVARARALFAGDAACTIQAVADRSPQSLVRALGRLAGRLESAGLPAAPLVDLV
jgi:hypothetical protein